MLKNKFLVMFMFSLGTFCTPENNPNDSCSPVGVLTNYSPDLYSEVAWTKYVSSSEGVYGNSFIENSDGTFLVAGNFFAADNDFVQESPVGHSDIFVMKLTAAGNFDPVYGNGDGIKTFDILPYDYAKHISKTSDGGFIVAGSGFDDVAGFYETSSYVYHGDMDIIVMKFNAQGNLDTQFDMDGMLLLGGSGYDAARKIVQTSDGGYVILADVSSTDGFFAGIEPAGGTQTQSPVLIKLTPSGNIDTTFGINGFADVSGSGLDQVYDLLATSDSGLILSGTFNSTDYAWDSTATPVTNDLRVIKLTAGGQPDLNFNQSGFLSFHQYGFGKTIKETNTGYLLGYTFRSDSYVNMDAIGVYKINYDGSMDPGFGEQGGIVFESSSRQYRIDDLALENNGNLIIAGRSDNYKIDCDIFSRDIIVIKTNPAGAVEGTFGTDGFVTLGFNRYDGVSEIKPLAGGGFAVLSFTEKYYEDHYAGNPDMEFLKFH